MKVFIVITNECGLHEIVDATTNEESAKATYRQEIMERCSTWTETELRGAFGKEYVIGKDSDEFIYDKESGLYYRIDSNNVHVTLEEVEVD